jgi:hypothetical protein
VICNFVCAASGVVFPVGLVVPVELRGIRRGHVWDRSVEPAPAGLALPE